MAQHSKLKFLHSPSRSYPSLAQGNYVGAQLTAGRRGTLPTFTDANSYSISKAGSDSNAGTEAAPFLTINKAFKGAAGGFLNDVSGNGYTLVQTGTVPQPAWPCYPLPPSGDFMAGPFSDSNYFSLAAGLKTALQGLSAWTFSGYFFFPSFDVAAADLLSIDAGDSRVVVNSDGSVTFRLNSVSLVSAANTVRAGRWVFLAVVHTSAASGGKQIWAGETPETAVMVASATQTYTFTAITTARIGRNYLNTGLSVNGYMSRLFFSSVARTSFPTRLYSSGTTLTSNILAAYYFQTLPTMVTAPLSYAVVNDSGEYDEGFRFNFPHELAPGVTVGLYAKDGYAPTFKQTRGATPGTYGAGNAARTVSGTPNYYINKTTGDDATGARNDATKPFKTIQAALSNGSRSANDVFEIGDSRLYQETLTLGTLAFTLRAASGKTPILKNANSSLTHLTAGAAVAINLDGLTFIGQYKNGEAWLDLAGFAVTLTASNCTLNRYVSVVTSTGSPAATLNFTSSQFSTTTAIGLASATTTIYNCYLKNSTSIATLASFSTLYKSTTSKNMLNCQSYTLSKVDRVVENTPYYTHNCTFTALSGATAADYIVRLWAGGTAAGVLSNCIFECGGLMKGPCLDQAGAAETTAAALDCTVLNALGDGMTLDYTFGGGVRRFCVDGLTVVNAVGYGVRSSLPTADDNTVLRINAVGCPSGAVYFAATATTYNEVASASPPLNSLGFAAITITGSALNTTDGTENAAPVPGTPAIFGGNYQRTSDMGADYILIDLQLSDMVVNGFIFDWAANTGGAIGSSNDSSISVAFCTFQNLGPFGVRLPAASSISDCAFDSVAGHALRIGSSVSSVSRCTFSNCVGAAILHYGQSLDLSSVSAAGCQYGLYEGDGSTVLSLLDSIFSGSGLYDYSGQNVLSYSAVGTLDPDRTGTVDANSIRLDPLFRDPASGDLRLMAIAAGSEFDSPCIAVGSTGADMGAFAFTYGSCELSWIEIDFATVSPSGANYRNPDKLTRELIGVKLAENDREDGKFDSDAVAYKLQYTCAWAEPNDMPLEQLIELADMFKSTSNEIHVCIDGAWIAARLVRGPGFQYEENSELGYTEASIPTPLRTLTFREA